MIGGEAIKNSLSAHPAVPVTRVPRSVSGACWPDECSPRSAAFPPHSPPSTARFCSNDSSVIRRCPTPRGRSCGPCGLSLHPPSCRQLGSSRRLRGLPVLVHEASRRVWGLRLRRTDKGLAISSPSFCLPPTQKRRRPDCIFSELNTQPACTPVYASPCASRRTTQNSGPSGSLLLSRRTLSFPASCRFIPAHYIGDFAAIRYGCT